MNIAEFLKEHNVWAKVSIGSRWMYWDDSSNTWVVRTQPPYKHKSKVLANTPSEELAIEALMKE